jgi:hypothetical protein
MPLLGARRPHATRSVRRSSRSGAIAPSAGIRAPRLRSAVRAPSRARGPCSALGMEERRRTIRRADARDAGSVHRPEWLRPLGQRQRRQRGQQRRLAATIRRRRRQRQRRVQRLHAGALGRVDRPTPDLGRGRAQPGSSLLHDEHAGPLRRDRHSPGTAERSPGQPRGDAGGDPLRRQGPVHRRLLPHGDSGVRSRSPAGRVQPGRSRGCDRP